MLAKLNEGGVAGPKRPENSPVDCFQRRPGGSPGPKDTLTGMKQRQRGKDARRFKTLDEN